jgi:acetyl-CoA acetyltransferase
VKAEQDAGFFDGEIMPVEIKGRKDAVTMVSVDEHPRAETTLEQIGKLLTSLAKENGTLTAGNASGVNDGAAALIIASEVAVKKYGLTPRARVVSVVSAGVAPRLTGIGPALAVQ